MLAALLLTLGLAALGLLAFLFHFRRWYERKTVGTSYFGRTAEERRAFKAELARRSALVAKLARLRARLSPPRGLPSTSFRGMAGPPQCRPADFERALRFRPGGEDVFVATQMPAGVACVASFLETPLTPAERDAVAEKSSFAYMKAHEERFEMAPPSPFSGPESSSLKSGRGDRHSDVGAAERARILAFCRERLAGSPYPAGRWYADLRA